MPKSTQPLIRDDRDSLSLTGIISVGIGLVAVAVANLTGCDSLESIVAGFAATYAAVTVMPFRTH